MNASKETSKCYICEQEFRHDNLKAHFLQCDQEHKCEICGKIYQTLDLLKNHIVVHDENKTSEIFIENAKKWKKVIVQKGQKKPN